MQNSTQITAEPVVTELDFAQKPTNFFKGPEEIITKVMGDIVTFNKNGDQQVLEPIGHKLLPQN